MTTELDDELVPAILALIDEVGTNMSFQVVTRTWSEATNKTTESGSVSHTRKASPPLEYEQRYIDGDLIQQGDARIFVAASGIPFTPVQGMDVTHSGVVWQIVSVITHTTGDLIAAYELQLRR